MMSHAKSKDELLEAMAISRRMGRMLDEAMGMDMRRPEAWDELLRPPVDLVETSGEYVFRVELPGLDREEIEIEVDQRSLAIRGEKRHARETEQQRYHRMECSYGRFERRFNLPSEIDPEDVTAKLEAGVLMIRVQKIKQCTARKIKIEGS